VTAGGGTQVLSDDCDMDGIHDNEDQHREGFVTPGSELSPDAPPAWRWGATFEDGVHMECMSSGHFNGERIVGGSNFLTLFPQWETHGDI